MTTPMLQAKILLTALVLLLFTSPLFNLASDVRNGLVTALVLGVLLGALSSRQEISKPESSLSDITQKSKVPAILVATLTTAICAVYAQLNFSDYLRTGYDDSFITFRYAENIARLEGFRFNPGDDSNSASSLVFSLLLALLARVTFFSISFLGLANVLNLAGIFLIVFWPTLGLIRRTSKARGTILSLAIGIYVSTFPPLVYWTFSGMETTFFLGLLMTVMFLGSDRIANFENPSHRKNVCFVIALVILAMTRVEGALAAGVTATTIVAAISLRHGVRSVFNRSLVAVLLAPPLAFVTQLVFYWIYYRSPISDPIYFKSLVQYYDRSVSESFESLKEFILEVNGPLVLLVGVLLVWSVWTRRADTLRLGVAIAPTVFAALFLFSLRSPYSDEQRYELMLLVPMLYSFYSVTAAIASGRSALLRQSALILVVPLAGVVSITVESQRLLDQIRSRADTYMYVQQARIDAGRWLQENTEPGSRVVSSDIGALSFFNRDNIYLDAAGLVNRTQLTAVREKDDLFTAMKSQRPEYLVDTIDAQGLSGVEQILSSPLSYYVPDSGATSSCTVAPIFSKRVLKTFPDVAPAGLKIRVSKILAFSC